MGLSSRGSELAVVTLCLGLATTACAYKPGSFAFPLAGEAARGEHVTVGCLDVAVDALLPSPGTTGQVVEVFFANRCDRETVVDFAALRAIGRDEEGRERALAIFDPAGQVRPLTLEARVAGREVIELRVAGDPARAVGEACLDLAPLARAPGERWVCVAGTAAVPAVAEVAP